MFPLLLLQIESLPGWASLGVGGMLAAVMFYFYRQDRRASEERMNGIIEDFRSIIESNTRAMTALEKAIEREERN